MRVPVRLTCACLAALAACGGSDPSAPTPAGSPTPKVSITSPELEVHGTGPVVIQAVVEGCTPDTVELRVDGETLAVLVPPFQYTWDTAWAVEGRREVTARASCGGAAGTSAPTFIWVDRSPPRVVARTPETGSAPWVKDPIAITFSEPVDLATARDAVVLRDAAGKAVPAAISASDGGARWTLSPAVAPAAGDTFTVEIGTGVRDLAGLALEPATAAWTFSYGALFEPARRPLAAWGILEAMAPDLAVNAAFEPVAAWHAGTTLFEITVSGSTVTERRELAPWGRRCGVAIRESEVFVADEGWFDPGYQVRLLHPAGAGFDLAAPAVTDGKRLAIDPDVTFAPDGTPVVVWVES